MLKLCSCGSGLPRYSLADARGIFCAYVCRECEPEKRAKYRPEIFTDPQYDAPDLGEDEGHECTASHRFGRL